MRSAWLYRSGRAWLVLALVAAITPAGAVWAAPTQQSFAPGAVVTLAGTPHIWIADGRGTLHWGGDTRALADKSIDWGNRVEATIEQVKGFRRGDPWLSAGLLKMGDPIYLVKWESNEPRPRLLHIQTIADVELFGIDGSNYGTFVIDREPWQERYGFDASQLPRDVLPPAVTQASQASQASQAIQSGSVRERPVRIGFAADGGDGWRIGVLGVTPNANDAIRAASQSNPPPPAGQQYFMVRLSVARIGETPETFSRALLLIGHSNVEYSSFTQSCGVVPEKLPAAVVVPMTRIVGNVCWPVLSSDVGSLVLYHRTTTSPSIPVYFALN